MQWLDTDADVSHFARWDVELTSQQLLELVQLQTLASVAVRLVVLLLQLLQRSDVDLLLDLQP